MTATLMLHRADGALLSTAFRRAAFGKDDSFAREREIAWEGPASMIAGRVSFVGELEPDLTDQVAKHSIPIHSVATLFGIGGETIGASAEAIRQRVADEPNIPQ